MAWQSSTINPATTSPAADITKITNDLNILKTIFGGGSDSDVPFVLSATTGTVTISGSNVTITGAEYVTGNIYINSSTSGIHSGSGSWALILGRNGVEKARIDTSDNLVVTVPSGIGYGAGSGGTVTQATSKSTAVTLNKPTGKITMNNAALAANTTVYFTLANSTIGVDDVVALNIRSGMATSGTYQAWVDSIAAGAAVICLRNISGGSLSEAIVLSFAVIKGATA